MSYAKRIGELLAAFGSTPDVVPMAYMRHEILAVGGVTIGDLRQLARAAEAHNAEPESLPMLGGTYETQGGERVKMVGITNVGTPYETLVDEAGVNRYSRRIHDIGRVTGSDHDYSDSMNLKRPIRALALEQIKPAARGACPTHCCPTHGCKYGHDDCPVYSGKVQPVYPNNNGCELCEDEPLHVGLAAAEAELRREFAARSAPQVFSYNLAELESRIRSLMIYAQLHGVTDGAREGLRNLMADLSKGGR